jgi:hypothetical protein
MGGSFAFVQCRRVDMDHLNSKQRLAAWLCGGGIILILLGYKGVTYLPLTPEEEQQEEWIRDVMRPMGVQAQEQVIDQLHEVRMRIDPTRQKPYWWPGTVALCLGIAMTGLGLVLWFRNTGRGQRFGWAASNDD